MRSYVDYFLKVEVEPLRNLRAVHTLVACVKTCTELYNYGVGVLVEEVSRLFVYQIGTNAATYLREFAVFELPIATQPETRLQQVMVLGMCFLIAIFHLSLYLK